MAITPLPTPVPSTGSPDDFDARADAFLGALPTFVTEANAQAVEVNDDAVQVAEDAGQTAADRIQTALDRVATGEDRVATGEDRAAIMASVLEFYARYLGAKTANPALDNEGEPLVDGAVYLNTMTDELRFYDLGSTSWFAVPANAVLKTSDTGSAVIPAGTEAQRDVTPITGYFRFNLDIGLAEIFNGTVWGPVGGGATGAAGNQVFVENDQVVTASYTITTGKNASSAGPITIADGVTVTIPDGSVWSII